MSDELIKVLVPAIFAMAGTLLGLLLGHLRWLSHDRQNRLRAFDAKRFQAYLALWETLEAAHVDIRTKLPGPEELHRIDQERNAFRMKNAIFLDKPDIDLANNYFNAVAASYKAILALNSNEALSKFQVTQESDPGSAEALNTVLEMIGLRDRLISRVQQVLRSTSYAASEKGALP